MKDLDNAIENLEAWEAKEAGENAPAHGQNKVLIGKVEQFYSRLNVVAITLNSNLKVGDVIEIGNEEDAVRQKITSMQIDRLDVSEASEGDSVGIKLKHPVSAQSNVYKIQM